MSGISQSAEPLSDTAVETCDESIMDSADTNTALQLYLNDTNRTEPVIGLSMMTEFRWPAEANKPSYFRCCSGDLVGTQHMSHIISSKHRYNYIKAVRPHLVKDWPPSGCFLSCDPSRELRDLAQELERDEGCGTLKVTMVGSSTKATAKTDTTAAGTGKTTSPSLEKNQNLKIINTSRTVAKSTERSDDSLEDTAKTTVSKSSATSRTDGKTTLSSDVLVNNSKRNRSSKSTATVSNPSDKPSNTSGLTDAQVCDGTTTIQLVKAASNVLPNNSELSNGSDTAATTAKPSCLPGDAAQTVSQDDVVTAMSHADGKIMTTSDVLETNSKLVLGSDRVAINSSVLADQSEPTDSSDTIVLASKPTTISTTKSAISDSTKAKSHRTQSASIATPTVSKTKDVSKATARVSGATQGSSAADIISSFTGATSHLAQRNSDAAPTVSRATVGSKATAHVPGATQVAGSSVAATTCRPNEDGSRTGHMQTYMRSTSHDATWRRDMQPLLFRAVSPVSACGSSPSSETSESSARSESKAYGTAVGMAFMVTVTHEKRTMLFCLLCRSKPNGYKQHRSCVMHQSNYVRMKRPDMNSDLSDSQLQRAVTLLAKQDPVSNPQAVIINSEREYDELNKAAVPEALDRIEAILRQQRQSQISPSVTDPQPESVKHEINMSAGIHEPSHHPDGYEITQRPDRLSTGSVSSAAHTQPEGPRSSDDRLEFSRDPDTPPVALRDISAQSVAIKDLTAQCRTQPVAPEDTWTQPVAFPDIDTRQEALHDPRTQPVAVQDPRTQPVALQDPITQPVALHDSKTQPVAVQEPRTQPVAPEDIRTQPVSAEDSRTHPVALQDLGTHPVAPGGSSLQQLGVPLTPRERQDAPPAPVTRCQAPLGSATRPRSPQRSGVEPRDTAPTQSRRSIKLEETQQPLVSPDRRPSFSKPDGGHQQPFLQPLFQSCPAGASRVSKFIYVRLSEAQREKVVGLGSVLECQDGNKNEASFYMCHSCHETVQLSHICGHIISTSHQCNYMREYCPGLMEGIRDRLNMDEDGFELAVRLVAQREKFYKKDSTVMLLEEPFYHRVRRAPYSEGIRILQAHQQLPAQRQSSQDPPPAEEPSSPLDATDSQPSKKHLTETTTPSGAAIVKTEPVPGCLSTTDARSSNIAVHIKQEVIEHEDRTHSFTGDTETRRPLKHGSDCASQVADAAPIKRRRISKSSDDGGGMYDAPGPSGSCSDIMTAWQRLAGRCPSPQNQDARVKAEPSRSPSPRTQEAGANTETASVNATLVSQLVQQCEALPEEKLVLILNTIGTLASSNSNVERQPQQPASAAASELPSTAPGFIDSSLAKQPVLQSAPSAVSGPNRASPSSGLTSETTVEQPPSSQADKDPPWFKIVSSWVQTKQLGRDVTGQDALVGRVKPRMQSNSDSVNSRNLVKRAAPKRADNDDDVWNYENRQFMPRPAKYVTDNVRPLKSQYRSGEDRPVISNPQLDCKPGIGGPSAITVISPTAAPVLPGPYNTMASPFNTGVGPYTGSPMVAVNPNPTGQHFASSDYRINPPAVPTTSPADSLPAPVYATPLYPYAQEVTHNTYPQHYVHGYPSYATPYGYPNGTPGQPSQYVNYADGSTGGPYPVQTPPHQGAGQVAISGGGPNLTVEAWHAMHGQQQPR